MARVERAWADLIGAFEREQVKGADPASPRVQELAARWQGLVGEFTGGDPSIRASLQRLYETEGAEGASRGAVTTELIAYVQESIRA
jgi:hypothetical protein